MDLDRYWVSYFLRVFHTSCEEYILDKACDDSNLHAVQAGNLGAAMAGSLPSCL